MVETPPVKLEKYRHQDIQNDEKIEQLNVNVALMIQQYANMERAIDKMNTVMDRAIDKMTIVLERLEARLEVLEKEKLREQAKNEGKKTIIEYIIKYWWAALFCLYFITNDPNILTAYKKIFA